MSSRRTSPRAWTAVATAAASAAAGLALSLPTTAAAAVPVVAAATSVVPAVVVGPVAPAERSASRTAPAREARAAGALVRAEVARAEAVRAEAVRAEAVRAEAVRAASRAAAVRAVQTRTAPDASACAGPGWRERRGAAALASLRPAAPAASAVRFRPARAGFLGLTHLDSRVVEVFVRSCAQQSDALLRHVVAHELGHAHDEAHLTPALRRAWLQARGIPGDTPWYGCDRCTDFATPAGDFAETYAQWRRGTAGSRSRMAPAPGPAALQALAARFFAG